MMSYICNMNINNTKNALTFFFNHFSNHRAFGRGGGVIHVPRCLVVCCYDVGYILARSRLTHRDRQAFTPNFESPIKLACRWTVGVCREPTKAQENMQTPHRKTPALQCSQTQDLLTPSLLVCQPVQKLLVIK